jgi:hypothetical protein
MIIDVVKKLLNGLITNKIIRIIAKKQQLHTFFVTSVNIERLNDAFASI